MKRADIILISSIILIAIISIVLLNVFKKESKYAYVYLDDEVILKVDLLEDKNYSILDGKMIIVVKNKKIGVQESDCHDHTCMHMGMTNSNAKVIICAYNHVCIKIVSEDEYWDIIS